MTIWIFRLLQKAQNDKFFVVLTCHTERSEVSTNLKREFVLLKRGFFILNLKCVLNSVDISLSLNMTSSVDFSLSSESSK